MTRTTAGKYIASILWETEIDTHPHTNATCFNALDPRNAVAPESVGVDLGLITKFYPFFEGNPLLHSLCRSDSHQLTALTRSQLHVPSFDHSTLCHL
ncbi:MAG: hypothetical protein JOZ78_17700 [Chroococcidiopsidaceae cyanobacterium CP_BM_ER_R8_30]|nr:hypothetical protein [Chroococcidiopsidaceae cyanobacterium CP_BM_ER_R8_30]